MSIRKRCGIDDCRRVLMTGKASFRRQEWASSRMSLDRRRLQSQIFKERSALAGRAGGFRRYIHADRGKCARQAGREYRIRPGPRSCPFGDGVRLEAASRMLLRNEGRRRKRVHHKTQVPNPRTWGTLRALYRCRKYYEIEISGRPSRIQNREKFPGHPPRARSPQREICGPLAWPSQKRYWRPRIDISSMKS